MWDPGGDGGTWDDGGTQDPRGDRGTWDGGGDGMTEGQGTLEEMEGTWEDGGTRDPGAGWVCSSMRGELPAVLSKVPFAV